MHTHSRIGSLALLAAFVTGCVSKDVPKDQKLADCTNAITRFQMAVQHSPPYQFVLGLPLGETSFSFRGEVVVNQSTGTVARIPISSDALTPCNWLRGHSGYILTWSRTNHGETLESFLVSGKTYDVEVRFSEQPPPKSSFWLSSMERVGL